MYTLYFYVFSEGTFRAALWPGAKNQTLERNGSGQKRACFTTTGEFSSRVHNNGI